MLLIIILSGCIQNTKEIKFQYIGKYKLFDLNKSVKLSEWKLHDLSDSQYYYWNLEVDSVRDVVDYDVVIAVLDDGFSKNEDIIYCDGYDFFDDDNNPYVSGECHGSAVSSIIASIYDNNVGIKGIMGYRVMPIRVTDGVTFDFDVIANGIKYAVDNGAKVINMSFGGGLENPFDNPIYEAVMYARENDVIVVASAGNGGPDEINYPAYYDMVIGVGALNKNGDIASFSGVGECYTYGVDMLVYDGERYVYKSGTSFSAPIIAGLMGIKSVDVLGKIKKFPYALERFNYARVLIIGKSGKIYYEGIHSLDVMNINISEPYCVYIWIDVNDNGNIDRGDVYGYSGFDGKNYYEDGGLYIYGNSLIKYALLW